MRRGSALLFLSLAVLGGISSTAYSQYPYPMPMPMPYGGMPQYGYPQYPMPVRPVYYTPVMRPAMPHYQYPAMPAPRVYSYGPLVEGAEPTAPITAPPIPNTKPVIPPTNPTLPPFEGSRLPPPPNPSITGPKTLPTAPMGISPEACSDGQEGCGPFCDLPYYTPKVRGRGHWIAATGGYVLVPVGGGRPAFTTSTGTTDFPNEVAIGPRVSLGYVLHNGWGVRGNYWYLRGDEDVATTNSDPTAVINTPGATGFSIAGPSASLLGGLGADQYTFSQQLEMHVADLELVKERTILNTTLLCSFGVRYARILQDFHAERSNVGGTAGGTVFTLDRQIADSSSRFEGWGPTASIDVVHPLTGWGLSFYGNGRGTWLWGVNRFSQSLNTQQRSVTGGVDTFIDTTPSTTVLDHRTASVAEAELGLQLGFRAGRCYIYGRAGAAYQHWWRVGTPTSASGDLSLFGGTAMLGITY